MNKVFLAALALLLAGCASPVPQALPPQMLPEKFTAAAPDAPLWPVQDWWQGFGDSELSTLIAAAQAGNRDIAIAAARVDQAQALAGVQRSALFPQLGLGADGNDGGCSGQSCRSFPGSGTLGLNVSASYALDLWGQNRNNLRAANEQWKSARFGGQAVALSVTGDVARQYLSILSLRRRMAIARENIAAIEAILTVINLRVKAGAASHLDLAREEAQIESVNAQLAALQTQEKQGLNALAVLLGRPPQDFDITPQNLDGVQAPVVAAGLPSELLLRRPDIAQAEADLAAAHANLDAARAAFLPQVTLTGSGGFVSAALGTLVQGSNFGFGYGAGLLQTLFDGGRLASQKDLARAVQEEYVATYQRTALRAFADVENALTQVANTSRAEGHLRRTVEAARKAFEISELQYRQGAADLLSVLQAQQTLFSAEDQVAQTVLANRQAIVHLFEALGGGWQEMPDDRTQAGLQQG
ncbi:MAG: hypothetical protein BGN82_00815 [Alphaproteobacteria bacterium 65-7]|nr:MAG: hypothetical protein BGN82_00815 [Alphaproteobacteria bacterium 65-7]